MAILSGLTISDGGLTIYGPGSAPPPATNDPYFMYNSLLLPGNGTNNAQNNTFLDGSTNNFTITRYGNTTQGTFSPYGGNWSNYFDGSGDYLSVTDNLVLQMSTGDFTVEAWVNPSALSSSDARIWSYQGAGGTVLNLYILASGSGSAFAAAIRSHGATGYTQTNGTTAAKVGTWYHVAFTRSSGTTKLFVNGVQEGSTQTSQTQNIQNATPSIGGYSTGNTEYLTGYISNLRIVKGTAVYTSNFTPSTTPLVPTTTTSLLTCADGRFIDDSINNLTITKNGDTSIQRFSPFEPSSLTPTSYSGYFDGLGDWLTIPNSVDFAFGTGDFTVECWSYITGSSGTVINYTNGQSSNSNFSWEMYQYSASEMWFSVFDGGTQYVAKSTAFNTNQWNHLAAVRSGNTLTLYVNGVAGATTVSIAGVSVANLAGATLKLCSYGNGSAYVTGYISNVRINKGTALYTSNFTPSTTPLTAISGTSLLTCQSSTFIDNSTNNFTITASGNSQPTTQNPFGYSSATTEGYTTSTIGGSGYFDGTGDYLTGPTNNTALHLTGNGGTGFTVEAWIYPTGGSGTYRIISSYYSYTDGGAEQGWMLRLNTSNQVEFGNRFASVAVIGGTPPLNAWTHVAGVISGTTIYLYVNGVSVGTPTALGSQDYNGTVFAVSAAKTNGSYTSYNFPGYISDVRTSTATLYTSNFVPPSAPLTAIASTSLLANMTNAGIIDNAMMNDLETVGNAQISTTQSKFGGSSMSFDGTGDYLVLGGNSSSGINAMGTGDFTIEFWLYANSVAATDQGLIDMRPASTNGYYPYLYMYSGQITYWLNSTAVITSSAGAITTGTWYHVALSRSGSSNKLFINGTQSGSTFTSTTALLCDNNRPAIGSAGTTLGASPFNGYIDDLRITKGYARYTSNFSVPTEAFPTY